MPLARLAPPCYLSTSEAQGPVDGGIALGLLDDHEEKVRSVLRQPESLLSGKGRFPFNSWVRCISEYGLLPGPSAEVPVAAHQEILQARERLAERLAIASDELDFLHSIVGRAGYTVTLANSEGMTVALRANRNSARDELLLSQLGQIWDERRTGTNGIGTALHDEKGTSVFHEEHFFSDYIQNACAAVPLFSPDCKIWAAINISTRNPDLKFETHSLALEVLKTCSERLSEAVFRNEFRDRSVIKLWRHDGRSCLLAVGDDCFVTAADVEARKTFAIPREKFAPFSMWRLFVEDKRLLEVGDGTPASIKLQRLDGTILRGTLYPVVRTKVASASKGARAEASAKSTAILSMDDWAGSDPRLMDQVSILRRLRATRLPVLILGETGVGKDTLAKAYHAEMAGREKPFVALNCAAVPESLIESELFGYSGGAFTGARKEGAPGRFVQADGGTLFLDEIGDMPVHLQTRLLRVLESGEVSPLGSGKTQKVDIQFMAATNQNLELRVQQGHFRQDLYHRLAGVVIDVPPLRLRHDRQQIIDRSLARLADRHGTAISAAARRVLYDHAWPGNLRELYLVVSRATALARNGVIEVEDLLLREAPKASADSSPMSAGGGLASVEKAEKAAIEGALKQYPGDIVGAAQSLGMSRATFYRRIRKHGLGGHI